MQKTLPQKSPPLPLASRKRILTAFLLCFVLCAHRIYAGKLVSGIAQIAWAVGAFVWMKTECNDLIAIIHSGPLNLETIGRVADWEQTHGVPYAPMLALIVAGIWIAADAALLLTGKFTDKHGNKITRWV